MVNCCGGIQDFRCILTGLAYVFQWTRLWRFPIRPSWPTWDRSAVGRRGHLSMRTSMTSLSREAQRERKEELWEIPWIQKMRTAPRFVLNRLLARVCAVNNCLIKTVQSCSLCGVLSYKSV